MTAFMEFRRTLDRNRKARSKGGMGMKPLIEINERRQGEPAAKRQRGAVQDLVLAKLRRGLMVGAFVPGKTITIRSLVEVLGSSRMQVSEAINQLKA